MKKIVENYEYNKKKKKRGSENAALSAERYKIYNVPSEEDRKIYHAIYFNYIKCATKISNKNKFSILEDECINDDDSAYESEEIEAEGKNYAKNIESKFIKFLKEKIKNNLKGITVGKVTNFWEGKFDLEYIINCTINAITLDELIDYKKTMDQTQITPMKGLRTSNSETPLIAMNPDQLQKGYSKRPFENELETLNEDNEQNETARKKRSAEFDENGNKKDSENVAATAKEQRRKNNKNMYRDLRSDNNRKPKTIVYALTEDQVKHLKNINLDRYVNQQIGTDVKGTKLTGHKLSIFPNKQTEFEAIITDKQWDLCKNEFKTLENRDYVAIIKYIGVRDIDNDNKVEKTLRDLGIIKWEPLIEDDPDFLAIKATCKNRETLKYLLDCYYYDGLNIKTTNGISLNTKVSPSVGLPKQCYKCYMFDSHFANNCPKEIQTCERCGAEGHVKKQCMSDFKCVNCKGPHSARNKECSWYQERRDNMISEALIDLTGHALVRPQGNNKAKKYKEAIKIQKDGMLLSKRFRQWEVNAENKVEEVSNKMDNAIHTQQEHMNEYCSMIEKQVNTNANTLTEAVQVAKETLATIDKRMTHVAKEECSKMELKLQKEMTFFSRGLDATESNLVNINNNLLSWREAATQKFEQVDVRLNAIEGYLGRLGKTHQNPFIKEPTLLNNITNTYIQGSGQGHMGN